MAANFATRPQCHLCCTHTHWQRCQLLATLEVQGGHFLATLPTFGNLATAWSISADRSWQRQLPLRSDAIGTNRYLMLYPLSASRPLPTAGCLLPSAHCPLPLRRSAQDRAHRTGARRRRTGPEAVSKRGLAHLPCGACPRFETASQRWPELAASVPREKMLSLFGGASCRRWSAAADVGRRK